MAVMNEDGRSDGEALLRCPSCDSPYEPEDNYCRHCGAALHAGRVPMVRDERSYAPVPWRQTMPVVARGAAVVAAGTLAEAVLRRLIGRALRRRTRPSSARGGSASGGGGQARLPARHQPKKADVIERPEPAADDHVVSETFLFRRVWLRRRSWPGE
jgi:hypothetical protein